MHKNNGYSELGAAIKDGLLLRNGWIYCDVEQTTKSTTVELENVEPEAFAALREQPDVDVDVLDYDSEARTATARVTKTLNRFLFQAQDPANVLYPKQWHSVDVQEIPFIARRHLEARDKLIRRGFPKRKVNQLNAFEMDTKVDSMARDIRQVPAINNAVDKSQELIEWFRKRNKRASPNLGRRCQQRLNLRKHTCIFGSPRDRESLYQSAPADGYLVIRQAQTVARQEYEP